MDVCLLWVLCVVRQRSLRRAGPSSRGVLPSVVCLKSVIVKPWKMRRPRPPRGCWAIKKINKIKKLFDIVYSELLTALLNNSSSLLHISQVTDMHIYLNMRWSSFTIFNFQENTSTEHLNFVYDYKATAPFFRWWITKKKYCHLSKNMVYECLL
jgi:hypothetical protein